MAKKKAAAKAKDPVKVTHEKSQGPTVGLRKTRLMLLGEFYGDSGLMNPRSIDPLVYMLAERGEAAFGPIVIENCQDAIAMTNANYPKGKALCFMVDEMVRKHLAGAFRVAGKEDASYMLKNLEPLSEASYIDYFMMVSRIERDAFRTSLHPAIGDLAKMVSGYQTEQAAQVCDAVVNFFKVTKNPRGFEIMLHDLCRVVKGR